MKAKSDMDPFTNEQQEDSIYQEMLSDARVQVRKDIMRAKAIEEDRKEILVEEAALAAAAKKQAEAEAKAKADAKAALAAEAKAKADLAAGTKLILQKNKMNMLPPPPYIICSAALGLNSEDICGPWSLMKAKSDMDNQDPFTNEQQEDMLNDLLNDLHLDASTQLRNLQAEANREGVNITQRKAILTAELDAANEWTERKIAKLQKLFEDKKRTVENTIKSMEVAYKVRIDKVTAAQVQLLCKSHR